MTRQAVEGLRHIATSKCSMLETDLRAKPEILRVRVSPKHIKTHQKTKAGGHGLIGVEISRASEQKYGVSTGHRLWEAF